MTRQTNQPYKQLGLLSLLLLILSASCTLNARDDLDTQATLEAVSAVAQTTEAGFNEMKPQVADNQTRSQTAQAEAEGAKVLAETAIARLDVLESAPVLPEDGALGIPISGGVAIGYDAPIENAHLFYQVDGLLANRDFGEFTSEINQLTPDKILVLALVRPEEDADSWHLLHNGSLPITATETLQSWSEYTIFAQLYSENANVHLTFDEGPKLSIESAIEFPAAFTLVDSLDEFEFTLEDHGLLTNHVDRLLLVEENEGVKTYTEVVFHHDAGAGGDDKSYYCQTICGSWCSWLC